MSTGNDDSIKRAERKNSGKLRWRNVPLFMIKGLIEVGQQGELKYSTYNFLKGMPVSEVMESLIRHYEQLESPFESDFDQESKKLHAYHIAWNALYIAYLLEHKPEFDDRYKTQLKDEQTIIELRNKSLNENMK